MTVFDVFNGDADGICALHQLRLSDPQDSVLVTGVKRDINLLKKVNAGAGDHVTVLDVSLDKNREGLTEILNAGASVLYFDHHFAGDIPEHDNFETFINTDSNVCTGLLVNGYLKGAHLPWAVTAAFGDNLFDSAVSVAKPLGLSGKQLELLKELGTYINYNGYGSSLDDLYYRPDQLYQFIKPYSDPFAFIAEHEAFKILKDGFNSDMTHAAETNAELEEDKFAVFILPDASWARRVSGVYANQLAHDFPDRAHAILSRQADSTFVVSVRAPLSNKVGADDVCRQFPSGGGRKAAAGINSLPDSEFDRFVEVLREVFGL